MNERSRWEGIMRALESRRAEILARWQDKRRERDSLVDDGALGIEEPIEEVARSEGDGDGTGLPASLTALADSVVEAIAGDRSTLAVEDARLLTRWMATASVRACRRRERAIVEGLSGESSWRLAFLSHELRNPIMSAQLSLGLLQRRGALPPSKPAEILGRSLERMRRLVEHTIDVQRIGHRRLERQPLPLDEIVRDAVADSEAETAEREVSVTLELSPGTIVDGDPWLISSAITNLVRNAIRFSPTGGRVLLRVEQAGPRVAVEVEDQCGGLPSGHHDDLFEPFVERDPRHAGYGLGLAIVKQAVELHGGRVEVRDVPGRGCIFRIELPATVEVGEAPPAAH